MTEKRAEALERLNRGIEDSRAEVQRRTMSLAQDYFGDSAETLKQQISENRAALEGLPDQIPGGRDEAFQMMFQELMDNYTAMEQCIGEAQARVADLDTDNIRRQGEVEATDAARRDAKELGIDLTEIEGTGSEGRITVDDVKEHSEKLQASGAATDQAEQVARQAQAVAGGATQQAQDAAGQAQETAGQVTDQAGQFAGQATDQVGQAAGQATDAVGGLTGGQQETAELATAQAQQVAGQATDAVGGLTGGGGPLGGVTDQVGEVAGQAQDVAGQATDQAGKVAGQATDQAGKVAGQAQDVAGQATDQAGQITQQAQDTAGSAAQQGQEAVGQATDQAGKAGDRGVVTEQGIIASDAARREAREKGIDLATIKGTGAEGRIVYWDVADLPSQKEADPAGQVGDQAQQATSGVAGQAGGIADQISEQATSTVDQAGQSVNSVADRAGSAAQGNGDEPRITKAARRKAEEMGRDLSQIQGSGVGGLITISDVVRG